MQAAYLDIYGVPTRVVTFGRWVEESSNANQPEDIIVCIPGNPGVTQFYEIFLQILHQQLGYPVWILGHAGHEPPKNTVFRTTPELMGNEKLYGLQGQVNHKLAFVETYVPKNARIHFIGHSIGAYIILELLKHKSVRSRTVKNYLLFPTIERIADSPNGKLFTKVLPYLAWLLVFLSWIFTFLPLIFQSVLIQIYTTYYSVEKMHIPTIINFIKPDALEKVFSMGFNEMEIIKKRDDDVIKKNLDTIKLYYGASDRWCPRKYCSDIKRDIPGIDAQVCTQNFEHAFVLRHSKEVANMVVNWIRN